jgi:hypothetical protein
MYRNLALSFVAGALFGSIILSLVFYFFSPRDSSGIPLSQHPASALTLPLFIQATTSDKYPGEQIPEYNSLTDPFNTLGVQNKLTLRKLLILNQLFNGGRSQLGVKQPLAFSDLALLSQLYGSEAEQLFPRSNFNIGDLLILNQLFNGGKNLNNSVTVSPEFGKLLLLYLLFHN